MITARRIDAAIFRSLCENRYDPALNTWYGDAFMFYRALAKMTKAKWKTQYRALRVLRIGLGRDPSPYEVEYYLAKCEVVDDATAARDRVLDKWGKKERW